MVTLANDAARDYVLGEHNDFPVIASDIIYEGAAVGDNGSGIARPLVAGDMFLGFAREKVNNSTGAESDKNVRVNAKGRVVLAVASAVVTDVGRGVYASDDDTFVLTSQGNSYIGKLTRFISAGNAEVEFDALNPPMTASITVGAEAADAEADRPG